MKLPPLNAIRAFESAARHLSFKRAAQELFVTPAAISQQIRILEESLGAILFERQPRLVKLTPIGAQFFSVVSKSLRMIAEAADAVQPKSCDLTISVVPSFAALWLSQRLPEFVHAHPEIRIRIEAVAELVNFEHSSVDLAIRHGDGEYPDTHSELLFQDELWAVCAPAYRQKLRSDIDVMLQNPRLIHATFDDYWGRWFALHGEGRTYPQEGLYFSHNMLVVDAAVEGQGLALVALPLVARYIADGRLEVIDPRSLSTGKAYRVVWPTRGLRPVAERFKAWLSNEVAKSPQIVPNPKR